MNHRFGVVIVAAGRGTRMGTPESKQFLLLQNKPVLVHTIERFQQMEQCDSIVLVTSANECDRCRTWVEQYDLTKVCDIVAGGKERQDSVYEGLLAAQKRDVEIVLIHDGVRPFVTEHDVVACAEGAAKHQAAVLAVPVKDTIKQANAAGVIVATPERSSLWAIQTPQAFRLEVVLKGHDDAREAGVIGTDDAMLVERIGIPVHIVAGDYTNIKLTTPEDLHFAEWWLMRNRISGEDDLHDTSRNGL